jgi:hypothetical protein
VLFDALQSVAQVCATDSEQSMLPRFVVVAADGVSERKAHWNRQSLVDTPLGKGASAVVFENELAFQGLVD